MNIYLVIPYH